MGDANINGESSNGNGVAALTPVRGSRFAKGPSKPRSGWSAEYAPAPESVKVAIASHYGHFINGKWTDPKSAKKGDSHFETLNPANEKVLSSVAQGSDADVEAAVSAAEKALPVWSKLPATERAKYIFRIARRIQERARELAVLETMDSGKPIKESRDVDVPLVAAHFFYYAGWADKLAYAFPGQSVRPIGVCGQIIPWNFPLLMAAWKLAPALACGNTCILKPAETTPLTALRLAEIIEECELPPGVVNIVTGDGRTGAAIVNHPRIKKIAFTGSTEVGKRIAKATAAPTAAGHLKKLTLELGGKSPHIIFEDASLDQAIEGIISGIYFNQGEVCCAGSRLFVQESILPQVIQKLEHRLASLRVGDPLDKNSDVGAVNSRAQLDRINHYLKAGPEEGATLHQVNNSELPEKGFWCRPCFFSGVQPSHVVAREEIFGPVLSILSFRTPEEAISRANNTPYGLAAGVWTDKGSKIFDIARKLKAGVVWCNTYNKFDPASPFGGYKESGFGREGGVHGLRPYVEFGHGGKSSSALTAQSTSVGPPCSGPLFMWPAAGCAARSSYHPPPMPKDRSSSLDVASERAVVAAVRLPESSKDRDLPRNPHSPHDPFGELRALAEQAGAIVVGEISQRLEKPVGATYMGKGKISELKALCEELNATTIIFDHDLSPRQISNLEKETLRKVVDRSELILDIFASRATSKEAQVQVELAQLEYTYPRLRAMWSHLERIKGGIGSRGPGEMQLEIDRRLVQRRKLDLQHELETFQARKRREVAARKREHYTVGIVGYTNAGKSTLFNTLTAGGAYADNRLFATLMTRTREWDLGGSLSVMLSDTVGFVRDIPHHLVASFKATLEEATHADLLLIVLDVADPSADFQYKVVNRVLDELFEEMAQSKHVEDKLREQPRRVLLLNKVDQLKDNAPLLTWQRRVPGALAISAIGNPAAEPGLVALADLVRDGARGDIDDFDVTVPLSDSKTINLIETRGVVSDRSYDNTQATVTLRARIGRRQLAQLRSSGARLTLATSDGKAVQLDPLPHEPAPAKGWGGPQTAPPAPKSSSKKPKVDNPSRQADTSRS